MRYATQRLLATSEKVINIALACGFESLGHFYRVFERAHGLPPHAYRKQQQAIVGR